MASIYEKISEDLMKLKGKGFEVETTSDMSNKYYVPVVGPEKSPYQGGTWKVLVQCPEDYPLQPPQLRFTNYIYHPNVYNDSGIVSMDAIKEKWSSECDLVTLFEEILPQQLLLNFDPKDPVNEEAAKLMIEDKAAYIQKVKELMETNATEEDSASEHATPKGSASDDATSKGSTSTDVSMGGKEAAFLEIRKRLVADFLKLKQKDFKVEISDEEKLHIQFSVRIFGPKESPYKGGTWKVWGDLVVGSYPKEPPELTFENNIYHPNIEYGTGVVSMVEINKIWSPEDDLVTLFEVFLPQLLMNFNPDDPQNEDAAELFIEDNDAYLQKAREITEKHGTPEEAGFKPGKNQSDDV